MTAGMPCLVTAIPGNREWIEDRRNGFLFQLGDHEALSSMILQLVADADLRALLGESAAWSVRRRINWEADFNALLQRLAAINEAQRSVHVEACTAG
jgi:glycosyltransferase involved in cell wall biosynthesis